MCLSFFSNATTDGDLLQAVNVRMYYVNVYACRKWTKEEDKKLVTLAREHQAHNWIEIARQLSVCVYICLLDCWRYRFANTSIPHTYAFSPIVQPYSVSLDTKEV